MLFQIQNSRDSIKDIASYTLSLFRHGNEKLIPEYSLEMSTVRNHRKFNDFGSIQLNTTVNIFNLVALKNMS